MRENQVHSTMESQAIIGLRHAMHRLMELSIREGGNAAVECSTRFGIPDAWMFQVNIVGRARDGLANPDCISTFAVSDNILTHN
ncbi:MULTISPECIES: hypothetical protein [unclassified Mesorhizobium]|uniref:hypothetical protein n=1 Tax=Mesorhizobium sp. LSHC426A00 TaxID=1287298 RepID=UPI0012ECB922|nr:MULTISPECIES: hypothetical protein [unclassified Mesorhizobium]